MKKFIFIAVMAIIAVNSAFAASDHSYKTRGDMTDEELAMVMSVRDKYNDLFSAVYVLNKKLGNAILTSSLGLVLDAGALTTGIITDIRRAKKDTKAETDLRKLYGNGDKDEELRTKFEAAFLPECEADRKANPNKYQKEVIKKEIAAAEQGKAEGNKDDENNEETAEPEESETVEETKTTDESKAAGETKTTEILSCKEVMLERFGTVDADGETKTIKREAMIQYLSNKSAGNDSFTQTMNWVRMGASVGGMVTHIASASIIASAEKDVADIIKKRGDLNIAMGKLGKMQMQAHTEKRKNNPLYEIVSCDLVKSNIFMEEAQLEKIQSNLKKAKIIPIVGATTSGFGAIGAGVGNARAVNQKAGLNKGLSIGATVASGVGAVANGVSIGVITSNRKGIHKILESVIKCDEWLWWDENGHAFEGTGSGDKPGFKCERLPNGELSQKCKDLWDQGICPEGAEFRNGRCAFCYNGSGWNPYVEKWKNPGVTCEIEQCATGFELKYRGTGVVITPGGSGPENYEKFHCIKPCSFQNGKGYQQWYNDKLLSCGVGFIWGIENGGRASNVESELLTCNPGYEMFTFMEGNHIAPLCLQRNSQMTVLRNGLDFSNFCVTKSQGNCESAWVPYTSEQNPKPFTWVQDHKACEKISGTVQSAKTKMNEMMQANPGEGIYCRKMDSSNEFYVFAGTSSVKAGRIADGTSICKWENSKCQTKSFLDLSNGTFNPDNPGECISYCGGNY